MTQFPNGPAPYLHPQLAWQTAERVLDSNRTTQILTPDIKQPANAYVQASIQEAARRAIEDVRAYGFDQNRNQDGVRLFGAYRDALRRDPREAAMPQQPAHGVAQFAIQEAPWSNRVPLADRQAVVNYVQHAINNAANEAREDVHNWSMGRSLDSSVGVARFNQFKTDFDQNRSGQPGNVLDGMTPAHLATGHGSAGEADRRFNQQGGARQSQTGLQQG